MAKHQDIVGHYASLYNRIGLWIIAGLTLLGFLAEQIAFKYGFTYSIVFSAVYFLLVTMINGRCWRKAAQKAGNGLTLLFCVVGRENASRIHRRPRRSFLSPWRQDVPFVLCVDFCHLLRADAGLRLHILLSYREKTFD